MNRSPDQVKGVAPRTQRGRKLLYVITSLYRGGAESLVVELATRAKTNGWTVGVVSMLEPEAYEADLRAAGVEVTSLGMRRGVPDPRGLARLAQVYRTFRPDVVHAHMVHANILARAARLLSPVPLLVSTAHNISEGGRMHYLLYRFTDWLSEFTTNVSHAAVQRYIELGAMRPGKSGYVPNGVSLERFARSDDARRRLRAELGAGNEFVWLTVGRITEQKDYPNLFRALVAGSSGSRLWLVGDGELRAQCEALVTELGLQGRVSFLGLRSDVSDLMSAADGFVLGSAWEGLPMVLLEAAASELPAVATDVGGVSEIVRPGIGYLVPPRDPQALGQAMRAVESTTVAERAAMGRGAREAVIETFDITRVVGRWEGLFELGLAAGVGRRRRRASRIDPQALDHALGNGASAAAQTGVSTA